MNRQRGAIGGPGVEHEHRSIASGFHINIVPGSASRCVEDARKRLSNLNRPDPLSNI